MDEGSRAEAHPSMGDDDWMKADFWTEWFRTRLVNGRVRETRKLTLKWKDVQQQLRDGSIEWLQVEVRRADVDTDEVLSAVAKRNSHGDYYLRAIVLPINWPTLPAEYLCRFQPTWIGNDARRYV